MKVSILLCLAAVFVISDAGTCTPCSLQKTIVAKKAFAQPCSIICGQGTQLTILAGMRVEWELPEETLLGNTVEDLDRFLR